jgi:hypothetical protein
MIREYEKTQAGLRQQIKMLESEQTEAGDDQRGTRTTEAIAPARREIGGLDNVIARLPENNPPRIVPPSEPQATDGKPVTDKGMLLFTGPGPHELPVADAVTIFDTSDPVILAIAVEFLIADQGIPTTVRIPLQSEQAAQLLALLQTARQRCKANRKDRRCCRG